MLVVLVLLMCQTDYVLEIYKRKVAGWIFIGFVSVTCLVNAVIIIGSDIKLTYKKIKQWFLKRKAKKALEKQKRADEVKEKYK